MEFLNLILDSLNKTIEHDNVINEVLIRLALTDMEQMDGLFGCQITTLRTCLFCNVKHNDKVSHSSIWLFSPKERNRETNIIDLLNQTFNNTEEMDLTTQC